MLWKYSKSKGLDLGQMGYQALASSCRQQKDGLELLKTMQVKDFPGICTSQISSFVPIWVCIMCGVH